MAERNRVPETLDAWARSVLDSNNYMTLGTSDPDGRPRVSPVYFTHVDYGDYYWVSSPVAHHSANVDARPEISLVVFDSTAAIGRGRAVYVEATASIVADDALLLACDQAFARVAPGAKQFRPPDLSGDSVLRLYRARADRIEVHVPARDPDHGIGVDSRRAVAL